MNKVEIFLSRIQKLILVFLKKSKVISNTEYELMIKKRDFCNELSNFKETRAEIEVFDRSFYLNPLRTSFSDIMGMSGLGKMYEKDCYGLKYIKNENPVFLDIGAHIGMFTRVAKHLYPSSSIYTFEPDRENFKLLKKNNSLYKDVFSYQYGVFDSNGKLELRESDQNSWRSTLSVNDEFFEKDIIGSDAFSKDKYEVDIITIDSFFEKNKVNRLDLIGITVPGEIELNILKGAEDTLIKHQPNIAVFVYPVQLEKVREYLSSLGYEELRTSYDTYKIFTFAGNC